MEIESSVPTVAANRPVCILQLTCSQVGVNTRAHENQGAICILLTAFGYLVVVFLCNLAVH